jgi:hypothetical protein
MRAHEGVHSVPGPCTQRSTDSEIDSLSGHSPRRRAQWFANSSGIFRQAPGYWRRFLSAITLRLLTTYVWTSGRNRRSDTDGGVGARTQSELVDTPIFPGDPAQP